MARTREKQDLQPAGLQLPSAERPQLSAVPPLILTPAYFPEGRKDLGQNRSFALISEFNVWDRVTPRSGEKKGGSYYSRSPKTFPILYEPIGLSF